MATESGVDRHRRRQTRFTLVLPVRFRAVGATTWRDGVSVNISGSGIRFSATEPLEPNTRIEVSFPLSGSHELIRIQCRALVVRTERRDDERNPIDVSALIEHYRFARSTTESCGR